MRPPPPFSHIERGYGFLEENTAREIASWLVGIVGEEYGLRYLRIRNSNVEASKLLSRGGHSRLVVAPAPPVLVPERLSEFIMLRLVEPVVVAPGESVEGYVVLRVDAAAVVMAAGRVHVVDSFPLGRPGYALYGTPSRGIIASYQRVRLQANPPNVEWQAVAKLVLRNLGGEPVEFTRIILHAGSLRLAYRGPRVVASTIIATASSPEEAVVQTDSTWRPPQGFREAPHLWRGAAHERKFTMLWGL